MKHGSHCKSGHAGYAPPHNAKGHDAVKFEIEKLVKPILYRDSAQDEIAVSESAINSIVFGLYGLSDKEIETIQCS